MSAPVASSPSTPRAVRVLWVLVAALFSLVVALVAGILSTVAGDELPRAVMLGGGAFGGTLLLCLTVLGALRVL